VKKTFGKTFGEQLFGSASTTATCLRAHEAGFALFVDSSTSIGEKKQRQRLCHVCCSPKKIRQVLPKSRIRLCSGKFSGKERKTLIYIFLRLLRKTVDVQMSVKFSDFRSVARSRRSLSRCGQSATVRNMHGYIPQSFQTFLFLSPQALDSKAFRHDTDMHTDKHTHTHTSTHRNIRGHTPRHAHRSFPSTVPVERRHSGFRVLSDNISPPRRAGRPVRIESSNSSRSFHFPAGGLGLLSWSPVISHTLGHVNFMKGWLSEDGYRCHLSERQKKHRSAALPAQFSTAKHC
jgi:hypothetical protein